MSGCFRVCLVRLLYLNLSVYVIIHDKKYEVTFSGFHMVSYEARGPGNIQVSLNIYILLKNDKYRDAENITDTLPSNNQRFVD